MGRGGGGGRGGAPAATRPRFLTFADFVPDFDKAFKEADTRNRNFVGIDKMLEALTPRYTKDEFYAGLRQLRIQGKYTMESNQGSYSDIGPAGRAAAVKEGGAYLVWISRKDS